MEEQQFIKRASKVRRMIMKGFSQSTKGIIGMMEKYKEDSKEHYYLNVWRQLGVECKNSHFLFIGHLETVAPELSMGSRIRASPLSSKNQPGKVGGEKKGPERELTWMVLHQALTAIKLSALRSLKFYTYAIRQVGVEVAVQRIEKAHGSLPEFAKIVLTTWWKMEPRDFAHYFLAFALPVGITVAVGFLVGLGTLGFGLLIMGGVILGCAAVAAVRRYKKKKLQEAQDAAMKVQMEAQLFFKRWDSLKYEATKQDIFTALDYLTRTERAFEKYCVAVFPEAKVPRVPVSADDVCIICREVLVAPDILARWDQSKPVKLLPSNYDPDAKDVVFPSKCSTHLFHHGCLSMWRSTTTLNGMSCPTCRTPSTQMGIILRYKDVSEGKWTSMSTPSSPTPTTGAAATTKGERKGPSVLKLEVTNLTDVCPTHATAHSTSGHPSLSVQSPLVSLDTDHLLNSVVSQDFTDEASDASKDDDNFSDDWEIADVPEEMEVR